MKIFILAGGFGTRLQSVVTNVPKPMADIQGKPFLDYQIEQIRKYFPKEKIYLLTHYMSQIIERYYQDQENIEIIEEKSPLGTGGSINHAIKILALTQGTELLVLNGDTYIKPDFKAMTMQEADNIVMLASFQTDCSRYGTLKIADNLLQSFEEKQKNCKNSFINAGCYYFKNLNFFLDHNKEVFSLENYFQKYLRHNPINIMEYNDVFIDIGIPEDYNKMKEVIKTNGKK